LYLYIQEYGLAQSGTNESCAVGKSEIFPQQFFIAAIPALQFKMQTYKLQGYVHQFYLAYARLN